MDIRNYLNKILKESVYPTMVNMFSGASDKIVKAINEKEVTEEVSVTNPKDISSPIVESQKELIQAVKDIPKVEIPEIDLSDLSGKMVELKKAIQEMKLVVNQGDTKIDVDTKGIIRAIEKMEKNMPKMEKQEVIDYTMMMDEMCKIMEKPHDQTEIIKVQELLKKLGTSNDLEALSVWLKVIAEKPLPIFPDLPRDKHGIPLFTPTKVGGGGGGGLTSIETTKLLTLATEAKQDDIIAAIENGSILDTNNSTTDLLLANETFTGVSTEILHYASIAILVKSDVASATDGLTVQFSADELVWHDGESFTVLAGKTKFFTPPAQSVYYRISYTNGNTNQAEFHLHTVLKKRSIKWSSHNIASPIVDEDDAELTKSVITGKKANGIYDNVSLTNGGNMKVSIEEYEAETNPIRSNLIGLGDITVGLTQVEIAITGTPHSIRIQADNDNTGVIFIGKTGVLADKTNDFVRLECGDEVILDYNDTTNALYAISDTAAQVINVGILL